MKSTGVYLFARLSFEDQSAAWTILPKDKYFHEIMLWYLVAFN